MDSEGKVLVFGMSLTAITVLGLIIGVTGCTVLEDKGETARVIAACQGDLHDDAARSSACTLALEKSGNAGR